jgi:negative regulator of sigma E activity
MSDYKQQISACLDGELSDEEIQRLWPDVEAADYSTACRYQMIAAAMRGHVDETDMIDVSNSVRVALLQEAALTAQKSRAPAKTGWLGASWWRHAGGMGIAASVALVMVMVATDVQSPGTDSAVASLSGTQNPIPASSVMQQPVLAARPLDSNIRPVANLNTYLNEHSEFAAQDTMQGRMPYVRAVSYESR